MAFAPASSAGVNRRDKRRLIWAATSSPSGCVVFFFSLKSSNGDPKGTNKSAQNFQRCLINCGRLSEFDWFPTFMYMILSGAQDVDEWN